MAKKYLVSGDQHYGITGQLLEIHKQLRMKGGSPLNPEKVRTALQKIIEPGYKEGGGLYEFPVPSDLVLDRVRLSGYLDTSFDGREVHPLVIRPLTKEQAFDGYRKSGGVTFVWDELEKNMPYTVPKAEILDVMILDFDRVIMDTEALAEMDKLGVRPLIYEELIQYGIAHPSHQEQKWLVGIGTKHTLFGMRAPCLKFYVGGRDLFAIGYGNGWGDSCRFLVVRK